MNPFIGPGAKVGVGLGAMQYYSKEKSHASIIPMNFKQPYMNAQSFSFWDLHSGVKITGQCYCLLPEIELKGMAAHYRILKCCQISILTN